MVTPLLADAGVVIDAVPVVVQMPEPVAGVLPASVAVEDAQRFWSGPAVATIAESTVIRTVSRKTQAPLVTVHTNV